MEYDNNHPTPPQAPENAPQEAQASGYSHIPPTYGYYGYQQVSTPYQVTSQYNQYAAAYANKNSEKKYNNAIAVSLIAVSLALLIVVGLFLVLFAAITGEFFSLMSPIRQNNAPPNNSFSVIQVVGEIRNVGSDPLGINDPSYHHAATVEHIRQLTENENNKGILLYMNTPGGALYETDEVYTALEAYKEATGRPVWAYMSSSCASGGYFISMAADRIMANPNTITGSIGVFMAMTDMSGLYDKIGLRTVLIRSGENKAVGTNGVPITEQQAAVYQAIIDENYNRFVEVIVKGRGMSQEEVRKLGDGRIYTGNQALSNGLIDELGDWDTMLAAFEEETKAQVFYPDFSSSTALGRALGSVKTIIPESETKALLSLTEKYPNGVPMVLYDPAA